MPHAVASIPYDAQRAVEWWNIDFGCFWEMSGDLTSATTNRTGSATLIPEQLWPPHVAGGQLLDAHYGDDRCHAESAVSHLADRLVAIEIQHHRRRTTGGHVE